MNPQTEVGRLAFRREGDDWNAYWTPMQHNFDGAQKLGSIRMVMVKESNVLKMEFMALMQKAFEIVIANLQQGEVTWGKPKRAPEAERAGHS